MKFTSRRDSLRVLAAGVLAAAVPRIASPARDMKRVGVMLRPGGLIEHWKATFPKAFAAHGFLEGQNLEITWFDVLLSNESALAPTEEVGRMVAARMVRADLDCLVTAGDPGTRYLQGATRTIPIVTDVPDPVAAGFAQTLARPGGNITGLHQGGAEISLKNLELLRKLVPDASCAAWFGWAGLRELMKSFEAAAQALGVRAHSVPIGEMGPQGFGRLRSEFAGLRRRGCTVALVAMADDESWKEVSALALEHRIAIAGSSIEDGVIVNYTSNRDPEQRTARRIPAIVARILRGMRPEDMPFEGPSRFQLIFNLKTAARIGLAVPPDVMMQADKLIR